MLLTKVEFCQMPGIDFSEMVIILSSPASDV